MEALELKIQKLERVPKFNRFLGTKILDQPEVRQELKRLQEDFVFVPTDKASNNISIICKKFYVRMLLKEVNILDSDNKAPTYQFVDKKVSDITEQHVQDYRDFNINLDSSLLKLPILFWIPKMHKHPSKQRFIAASSACTTKTISAQIGRCLRLILKAHKLYCERIKNYSGFNLMWIVENSMEVHKVMKGCDKKARNMVTYDFSTLYTSIPHKKLKQEMSWVINKAFSGMNKKLIRFTKSSAYWSNKKEEKIFSVDCKTLIRMVDWLIDNTFVVVGDKVFQQKIGIPMGTDCAPFLANLFLFAYEFKWMYKMLKDRKFEILNHFRHCCRYIDDLLGVNNDSFFEKYKKSIYPPELDLTTEDKNDKKVHFLDLDILIKHSSFSYCIYDKRDNFNFKIVNFPDLSGNIPTNQSYGVFISQLVRFARGCLLFADFRNRTQGLVVRLLRQNFKLDRLKTVYAKFCFRYKSLIQKYGLDVFNWSKVFM